MSTVDVNAIKIAMGQRALEASSIEGRDRAEDIEHGKEQRAQRRALIEQTEARVDDLQTRLDNKDYGGIIFGIGSKKGKMEAESVRLASDLKVHDQVVQDSTARRESILQSLREQDGALRDILQGIEEFDRQNAV